MRNVLNAEVAARRGEQRRKSFQRTSAEFRGLFVKSGLLLLLAIAASLFAAAPPATTARVKGFRVPKYFDPPHATQMESLLEGAEAEPQPGGLILITSLRVQMFDQLGQTTMVVNAPRCVFDSSKQTVSSDGPLQVRTTDGKLLLEGEGFLWQHANYDLFISNRVSTSIRGTLNNSLMP